MQTIDIEGYKKYLDKIGFSNNSLVTYPTYISNNKIQILRKLDGYKELDNVDVLIKFSNAKEETKEEFYKKTTLTKKTFNDLRSGAKRYKYYLQYNAVMNSMEEYKKNSIKFQENITKKEKVNIFYKIFDDETEYPRKIICKKNAKILELKEGFNTDKGKKRLECIFNCKPKKNITFVDKRDIRSTNNALTKLNNKPSKDTKMQALHHILYGPPGTGKTYSTVAKALEILEATNEQKEKIKSIGQLKEVFGSQVEFVTFHQSFSYEDFVEGLKAESDNNNQLTYYVQPGIFRSICEQATINLSNSQSQVQNKVDIEKLLNDFSFFVTQEISNGNQPLFVENGNDVSKNTFFGDVNKKTDGSFQSFQTTGNVKNQSLTKNVIIRDYQDFYDKTIKGYKDIKPSYKSAVSYHGNALYYYQLFLRMEKFHESQKKQGIDYLISKKDKTKKNFVLIIDEINRGNISRIFGELITLIEESKRTGNDEEISVQLPYSKKPFSVPNNLYIIGTMNTADRSLTLMDTALRRRFDFIEMLPNPCLLHLKEFKLDKAYKSMQDWENNWDYNDKKNDEYFHQDYIGEDTLIDNTINLRRLLFAINEKIEILYDREHTIGHAFLMNIDNLDALRNAFKNKILPLLEEYFYDDSEKIQLVLNDDKNIFYEKKEGKLKEFNKTIYVKQDTNKIKAEAFTNIYQFDDDEK